MITPKIFVEFWNDFVTVLSKKCDLAMLWDNTEAWTNLMLCDPYQESPLLFSLFENKFKLTGKSEYRKFDAVFFSKETFKNIKYYDGSGIIANTEKPIGIEVVIEHENDYRLAFEEIMKLTSIKGKLKVLMTYPKNLEAESAIYEKFREGIIQANNWMKENVETKYLLICGYKEDRLIVWNFFSFNIDGENENFHS
jgi:hypothetical protein